MSFVNSQDFKSVLCVKPFFHYKEKDLIYFDKAAAHKIEIDKEPYHVIKQENVVVVL